MPNTSPLDKPARLKAALVNSALPPFLLFLNFGYFVFPAKKLENADCQCLSLCDRRTELTCLIKSSPSVLFHLLSIEEVST
jgi:hypothetical protein